MPHQHPTPDGTEDPASQLMADKAYATVRRDILACLLRPGTQVSEASLVERYGFGKGPVRSALARLRQDGLVSNHQRRAFTVTAVTLRDVRELFDLRVLIEPACARLAAGKISPAQIQQLEEINLGSYQPGNAESILGFLDANKRFHMAICDIAGHQRFGKQMDQMLDEMTRVMLFGLDVRKREKEIHHEHSQLIEALKGGNGDLAYRVAVEQIEASRCMVLNAILGSDGMLDMPLPSA